MHATKNSSWWPAGEIHGDVETLKALAPDSRHADIAWAIVDRFALPADAWHAILPILENAAGGEIEDAIEELREQAGTPEFEESARKYVNDVPDSLKDVQACLSAAEDLTALLPGEPAARLRVELEESQAILWSVQGDLTEAAKGLKRERAATEYHAGETGEKIDALAKLLGCSAR